MSATVVALMSIASTHIIERFKKTAATNPESAITMDELKLDYKKYTFIDSEFEGLEKRGIVKRVDNDRFWFSEELHDNEKKNGKKIVIGILGFVVLIVVSILVFN